MQFPLLNLLSWARALLVVPLVVASLAAGACGTSPATDGGAAHSDTEGTRSHTDLSNPTTTERTDVSGGATVTKSGVVFLVQPGKPQEGPDIGPSAAIAGKLMADEKGCLRLEGDGDPQGHLPVWPPGYSLSEEGGEMRVLDDQGRSVARVGREVYMGGGEIRKGESGRGYEEKRKELGVPGTCRGPFWMVGTPVRED